MTASDFSPVAETGEIPAPSGIFGRWGRKHSLEPLGGGFARILLDEQGRSQASGNQLTAGQKYWSGARSWVKVDTGTHRLQYTVDFSDPLGSAGFIATISVTASVKDADGAAQDGCTSAGEILVPLLREAIEVAAGSVATGEDQTATLSARLAVARNAARALVGTEPSVPVWLAATVTSVSVDFDDTTARRHADLTEKQHGTQLIAAEGENRQMQAKTEMEVRDIVRNSLKPHLRDSMGSEIEAVVSAPTTENINAFAAKLSNTEQGRHQALFETVQVLIDKDMLDPENPVFEALVQASSKALEGMYEGGAPELEGGTGAAEITGGGGGEEEPLAESQDTESGEDGDNH